MSWNVLDAFVWSFWEKCDHLRLSPGTPWTSEKCYFIPSITFDWLFKGAMSFISLTLKLTLFLRYMQHNNDSKLIESQKIIVYRSKKSIKSLYSFSWNVLGAFVWSFLVLTTSFKLGMNRIKQWNDNWIIFVETSRSNTLSTAKFIWNCLLKPKRKISSRQKKMGPQFLSLNSVQFLYGVSFFYRKSLERIRSMRNVTI